MKKTKLLLVSIMAAALIATACAPANVTVTQSDAAAETAEQATDTPEQAQMTEAPEAADSGLTFSLTTLTGDTLDQSIFTDNKLIMVNYWATWCPPCVGEIPDLVKISDAYAGKGFVIIGVLTGDDDIDGAKAFLADQGVTYPVVTTEGFFLDQIQGYQYIPTTLFFDSEGNQVGEAVVGANSYDDWAATIDELLIQVSK